MGERRGRGGVVRSGRIAIAPANGPPAGNAIRLAAIALAYKRKPAP